MGKTRDRENRQFLKVMNGLQEFEIKVIKPYANRNTEKLVLNHPNQGFFQHKLVNNAKETKNPF